MQQFGMSTDAKPKRGPPFKPEEELRIQRSIRLVPHLWAKIMSAEKAEFEALIEAWKPKTKRPTE
jgi:hypothetical protein